MPIQRGFMSIKTELDEEKTEGMEIISEQEVSSPVEELPPVVDASPAESLVSDQPPAGGTESVSEESMADTQAEEQAELPLEAPVEVVPEEAEAPAEEIPLEEEMRDLPEAFPGEPMLAEVTETAPAIDPDTKSAENVTAAEPLVEELPPIEELPPVEELPPEEPPAVEAPAMETFEAAEELPIAEDVAEPAETPVYKEAETPVAEVRAAETPVAPVPVYAAVAAESSAPAHEKAETPSRDYTKAERKLRKKYKIDNDELLSSHEVISGFVIAQGEKVIRTYHCLASDKGDGTLCLTNRRLLVNANERSEVSIEQISGIKFSKYAKFYVPRLLFALLFLAIAVLCILITAVDFGFTIPNITGEGEKMWAVILCYVGAGISAIISLPFFLNMVKKTFYFYIYARQDQPFVECKSSGYLKREKKGQASRSMVAAAGKESEKAARELGALLIEIKEGRYDN